MVSKNKKLRSGYTTGACAAAAAKAATWLSLNPGQHLEEVEIPFPDGRRVKFSLHDSRGLLNSGWASVKKDAGDDPDVTNGAIIVAEVSLPDDLDGLWSPIIIKAGQGVGMITKPGLCLSVGEPAINPGPRQMIQEAVLEAVSEYTGKATGKASAGKACCTVSERSTSLKSREGVRDHQGVRDFPVTDCVHGLKVTISVTDGERLAKKTLNPRLGIIGGLSILGTTGLISPLSAAAWTGSLAVSLDVARATGQPEVVLSSGRSSEAAHRKAFYFSEECYVMMGDYVEFSLVEAGLRHFRRIHLCSQWAKMLKIALSTPQTHVRYGAIDIQRSIALLKSLGLDLPKDRLFHTVREIFIYMLDLYGVDQPVLTKVCLLAKRYAEKLTNGVPVITYLVSYEGKIMADGNLISENL